MKRFCLAVATVAGLAFASSTLAAQAPTFGVGLGLTMPMGDYSDAASSGFHGTANVAFGLGTGPLGIRADLGYHRTGLEGGVDGNSTLLGGMANVVFNIQSAGQIKPYLMAGLGYYNVKFSDDVESIDESNLAFGGGVGVNFNMASTTLFAELRYVSITEGDIFASLNFVPITVGLRFGGK